MVMISEQLSKIFLNLYRRPLWTTVGNLFDDIELVVQMKELLSS